MNGLRCWLATSEVFLAFRRYVINLPPRSVQRGGLGSAVFPGHELGIPVSRYSIKTCSSESVRRQGRAAEGPTAGRFLSKELLKMVV
ncbi:hypothetical protein LshimejAT787_0405160 [Lyophyllum shimeji]|uniref:Uncharacterized protein n=1 Tax=Lyophyllum shimeji TaxID=47721 RepID=A0A9P3UN50_LYOSH|nr:hypothetical protein LshimejAT787_0405160 [Lyophyllum shimeji]